MDGFYPFITALFLSVDLLNLMQVWVQPFLAGGLSYSCTKANKRESRKFLKAKLEDFRGASAMRTKRQNRSNAGSAISEFAPALFIFLILFLIPCINLVFYAAAVVSIQHIVEESSRAAAVASTQTEAISNIGAKASSWLYGGAGSGPGLGAFAHLTANGGIAGPTGQPTGCSLQILITDGSGVRPPVSINGNSPVIPLPYDDPQNPATNASTVQYEYQVTGSFTVAPFLNMAGIPGVGQVPAVGAPTTVNYVSKAQIENVAGLDN
jgi:hypothetical protein